MTRYALMSMVMVLMASEVSAAKKRRRSGRSRGAATSTPFKKTDGPWKVAILPLGSLGISSAMMANLENLLLRSVDTIEAVSAIAPMELQVALQNPRHRALAQCEAGQACAVKHGRLVGADAVVFGSIGALGQNFSLNLRLVDVDTGKELARRQTDISGNRDLLIPEIRLAAYRLVAPDKIVGALWVQLEEAGIEVEIDGRVVATTLLERPIEGLAAGRHVVVLRRNGTSVLRKTLEVRPFETTRLKITLEETAPAQDTSNK